MVFPIFLLVFVSFNIFSQLDYTACYTSSIPIIDGQLDDTSWISSSWTEIWEPLSQKDSSLSQARGKIIWDKDSLYLGILIVEDQITVKSQEERQLHQYDSVLEIFFDPNGDGHRYHETQINPVNTVWPLLLPTSYRQGGIPIDPFDLYGFRSAVYVEGTINDDRDHDQFWSVEIAIPWSAFKSLDVMAIPPRKQDVWRINLANVSPTPSGPNYQSWSMMSTRNLHDPANWVYLRFSR